MSVAPRLRAVDLNLLPILQQLLADRNVTRAAEALALSQPAVSKALARLRAIFDDPLLVRDGRGMMLTPRAERLRPHVEEQCRRLQSLWEAEEFDPRSARRNFTIAATDYEAFTVLPQIAPTLLEEAPLISLSFREMRADFTPDNWTEVDFVIGADEVLATALDADVVKLPLLREEFVTVVGSDHPLAHAPQGTVDIRSHPQLIYGMGNSPLGLMTKMQPLMPPNRLATVPNFTLLPILALLTGAAAFVPRMVASRFAAYLPITILEGNEPHPAVNISMAWHRRWDSDDGHRWLRELIAARCTQV